MALYDLPGKTILTHNPRGLRIELSFSERGELALWISPRPADRDARIRNFSNRDDHTSLFDRILLPGLSREGFGSCDWDPFHVIVKFQTQTLHLVSLAEAPAVALWFTGAQQVDFKSDKADAPLDRSGRVFAIRHPDRGLAFEFAAALGQGTGQFLHQLELDTGRSIYARANAAGGQLLVIGGGLRGENVRRQCQRLAGQGPMRLLADNEKSVAAQLQTGRFTLRNQPQLQKLLDRNRRLLLAMQDPAGAIRAALNRIYYMIWTRDGSIIEAMLAATGHKGGLERWADFLDANPYVIPDGRLKGRKTYAMLVNPINKWEEDGVFYAIWATFTAWTQSGAKRYLAKSRQATLRGAMSWLEDYIYDRKMGLFGRYYACESPFAGARDDGFDNAVGLPTGYGGPKYEGRYLRRSYDLYINQYAYASYAMLAAMNPGPAGRGYLRKAAALRTAMQGFFTQPLPSYGMIETDDGRRFMDEPYGRDLTDYVWAMAVPPLVANPDEAEAVRRRLLAEAPGRYSGYFLAGYFSLLRSIDLYYGGEREVLRAVEYAARQCYRAGEFLAMPNTVVEMLDKKDGDRYHDVRPQAFSIGPWLATMTGMGLRRLPFGLAVRNPKTLAGLHDYAYQGRRLQVKFSGDSAGPQTALWINGKLVRHTLQIPAARLDRASCRIAVRKADRAAGVLLVDSTIELMEVTATGGQVGYEVRAHGINRLVFEAPAAAQVRVTTGRGRAVPAASRRVRGQLVVEFGGQGEYLVRVGGEGDEPGNP